MAIRDPKQVQASNLERLNSGWAATAKKQRLALQSIADHIRNAQLTPDEAAKWVEVQQAMIGVADKLMESHKKHNEFWKDDEEGA